MIAHFCRPAPRAPLGSKGEKASPRDEKTGEIAVEGVRVRDFAPESLLQSLPSLPDFPQLGSKLFNKFNTLWNKGGKGQFLYIYAKKSREFVFRSFEARSPSQSSLGGVI